MAVLTYNLHKRQRTDTLMGEIKGDRVRDAVLKTITDVPADGTVWNLDFDGCRVDYRFVGAFLGKLLDHVPPPAVLGVTCHFAIHLEMIRHGLSWSEGERFVYNDERIAKAIASKKRFITVRNVADPESFVYLGMSPQTDADLLRVLQFAERVSPIDADVIATPLQLKAAVATKYVELLDRQRLIIPTGGDAFESVAYRLHASSPIKSSTNSSERAF